MPIALYMQQTKVCKSSRFCISNSWSIALYICQIQPFLYIKQLTNSPIPVVVKSLSNLAVVVVYQIVDQQPYTCSSQSLSKLVVFVYQIVNQQPYNIVVKSLANLAVYVYQIVAQQPYACSSQKSVKTSRFCISNSWPICLQYTKVCQNQPFLYIKQLTNSPIMQQSKVCKNQPFLYIKYLVKSQKSVKSSRFCGISNSCPIALYMQQSKVC